jgi:hypothetical protein
VRVSIREIRDYVKCPLQYKLRHIDEMLEDRSIENYFRDYFKLVIYFYYFSIIENKKKSFEAMMKRWEELWFSSDMMELFPEAELKEKSNEAVTLLTNFIKKYGEERCTPIAANFQYEAIFEGKENLHVTGDIDLIKIINDRTNRKETCLVDFSLSKTYPDSFLIKNDISLSVASFAFRSNFKSKEDKMIVQSLRRQDDTPTLRTGMDYSRAERSIRNICIGIRDGIFYPNPTPMNCPSCSYRLFCLNDKSINMGNGETNVRS